MEKGTCHIFQIWTLNTLSSLSQLSLVGLIFNDNNLLFIIYSYKLYYKVNQGKGD